MYVVYYLCYNLLFQQTTCSRTFLFDLASQLVALVARCVASFLLIVPSFLLCAGGFGSASLCTFGSSPVFLEHYGCLLDWAALGSVAMTYLACTLWQTCAFACAATLSVWLTHLGVCTCFLVIRVTMDKSQPICFVC